MAGERFHTQSRSYETREFERLPKVGESHGLRRRCWLSIGAGLALFWGAVAALVLAGVAGSLG